jgi:DNA-binding GntR family transcriptional regulator
VRLADAEDMLEEQLADDRVAELLQLTRPAAVLFAVQRLFATNGNPVAMSTGWLRGDSNAIQVIRRR